MPKGVYERKNEQERFWEKVDVRGEDECWVWTASKDPDGYGYFTLKSHGAEEQKGKTIMAHRYSLMMKLNNFDLPPEVLTRHSCDNRGCVNPRHLLEGSAKDNSADMVERNRQSCGENHHSAKMTEAQARDCIQTYQTDKQNGRLYGSLERLAKKHNLSKQVVYRCVSGKTWCHLHNQET